MSELMQSEPLFEVGEFIQREEWAQYSYNEGVWEVIERKWILDWRDGDYWLYTCKQGAKTIQFTEQDTELAFYDGADIVQTWGGAE